MFDMKNIKKEIADNAPDKKPKIPVKLLEKSDYFGEISLLFGCKRTATVKAKKYS